MPALQKPKLNIIQAPDAKVAATDFNTTDNASAVQLPDPVVAANRTETVIFAGSGLVFDNTYGSGVSTAFIAAIVTAENFFQSHFSNSITLNMSFNLASLGNQFSGSNDFDAVRQISYTSLVAALTSHATTADDLSAVRALPAQDPSGGAGFMLPTAEAINLGLVSADTVNNDSIVLNQSLPWTYGADAVGVLEHEMSEGVFGRIGGVGVQNNAWGPMDLFRYSAPHQLDESGGSDGLPTYFSVDGTTLLTQFHNALNASGVFDGQDFADWNGSVQGDAFGSGGPGMPGTVSATDLRVLDVVGWTPNPTIQSSPASFTVADTTTNQVSVASGVTYTGPVAGLQYQFIDITPDSLAITPSVPNAFIHSGAGEDAIDVSKVNGNNILDGSTGSNFLVGGSGDDVFYMDDRSPASPVFSTIVNFHRGDTATVWGVNATDFKLTNIDNQGAAGYLGLDYIFTSPGHVATSFVLTGYTSADLVSGRLTASYGTTPNLPNLPGSEYMTINAS